MVSLPLAIFLLVIPAKAGIQLLALFFFLEVSNFVSPSKSWIPAFAGMTSKESLSGGTRSATYFSIL